MKLVWMLPLTVIVILLCLTLPPYIFSEYILKHFVQDESTRAMFSIMFWIITLLSGLGFILDKKND